MSNCGCPGTWNIKGTGSSGNLINVNYAGFEFDNPYLENRDQYFSGRRTVSLISACDGRFIDPYWAYADTSFVPQITETSFTKDDPNCQSESKYDCINGACISSTTYNTPGLYSSLSDCEVACGSGCSGVCISSQDWAQIQGLANQLRNKNCS